ncbi:MAG TPA: helix-turn-helix transcriptional regulator, partial [Xanthobacteraceae bacterium]
VRLPFKSLAPICADLDRVLFRPISARTPALALLASYAAVLQDTQALATPELRRLVVAHMHDLVALAVGATRDAAETARGRGVRAARLRAIKADIAAHVGDEGLSVTETAKRHRVTPRYLHMLFEAEGKTFSDYVIEQRLARAYRILTDARFADRAISAIAFEVGFGNLSYFNRVFRRRYGATPSEVREAAWRQSRN